MRRMLTMAAGLALMAGLVYFTGPLLAQPAGAKAGESGGAGMWSKPADWPATEATTRKPSPDYYAHKALKQHDPTAAPSLGLTWQLPVRAEEFAPDKLQDLGGVYVPTLKGRENGGWDMRYAGIHRGHDLGMSKSKLGGRKIPVHAVADGVYDGQRTYEHAGALAGDCKPMVVYHFASDGSDAVYTSIYCHVNPDPNLKVGQRVKGGDVIATVEDPNGLWGAHNHLELYTRPVYESKDSTKFDRCGCKSVADCDAKTAKAGQVPRGCGIFEDDEYILDGVMFIKAQTK
jgi:murein DD-endopeptidase MepM/ murein hydrolase activator NlpD